MGGSRSVGGYDNEALFKDERELAMQGQPGQRMEEYGVSWDLSESHVAGTS